MKEYSFPLEKSFLVGLRPEASTQRNIEGLTRSFNASPSTNGLIREELYTSAFPSIAEDFPFPQVYFLRDFTFVGLRNGLYLLQGDGTFLRVIDQTVSMEWEVLDFGPYVLVTNSFHVWERDVDTGVFTAVTTIPTCGAIENFNGQLITAGDLDGNDLLNKRVSWSRVGQKSFAVGRDNIAGFTELFDSGSVHNILSVDKGFIVYADNCVIGFSSVQSPVYTFGQKKLLPFGVKSRGSVAKGNDKHIAVMSNGDLYEFTNSGAKYLGFTEFFDSFEMVRITYNPLNDEFYISNGLLTYVYSASGLGQLGQIITSGGIYDGEFYAMAGAIQDSTFEVVTDTFDMQTRGQKTLYAIEVAIDSAAPVEVACDWRSNINEGFRRSKWVAAGPTGIATLIVTGVEFRLAIRVTGPGEVNLASALVRWKLTDKRSIRGQYGG